MLQSQDGLVLRQPYCLAVAVGVARVDGHLVSELNPVRSFANSSLAGIDNLVRLEPLVGRLLGFLHHAYADADEPLARLGVGVSQSGVMSEKLFHRTGDRIVRLRVVLVEPGAEGLLALVTQAVDHARPIEPRPAIVAQPGVRQIQFRIDGARRNPAFRSIRRSYRHRYAAKYR